jgi:hypothetical protein
MKAKELDCVEMQHQGAKDIREKLAGKTGEEQLEYWRKRTENLHTRQKMLRKKHEVLDRAS